MSNPNAPIQVVAADPDKGDLIVHFSNGTSILYHAHFLHEVRDDDGNIALAVTDEDETDSE